MGALITTLRKYIERQAGDNTVALQIGGILITFILIIVSGLSGWLIERFALQVLPFWQSLGAILVIIVMASTLAANSLRQSVLEVLTEVSNSLQNNQLHPARTKLSHIVGRDVWGLTRPEILRATAETASENSVDGIFAPLFWMFVGASLWNISTDLPGPLALSLIFKASSTIDSMIGYKYGRLRWLGTAGAKLDDLLTWIPCRIVMLTLPLVSKPFHEIPRLIMKAYKDGSRDNSPNSGLSEAIFAHCANVKMGGSNKYNNLVIIKPILARNAQEANIQSINKILNLSLRLEIAWVATILILVFLLSIK